MTERIWAHMLCELRAIAYRMVPNVMFVVKGIESMSVSNELCPQSDCREC